MRHFLLLALLMLPVSAQGVVFQGGIPRDAFPAGPPRPQGDPIDTYARLEAPDALRGDPAPGPDPMPDPGPDPDPVSGDAPYNLGTLPAFLDDLEWPVQPTTTSTVQVSADTHWKMRNNTLYVVAAGNYSSKTVTCNNCEFRLDDEAVINGALVFDGSVIKWTGGRKTGSGMVGLSHGFTNDLLIDNFHGVTESSELNDFSGSSGWRRVAIINTTLEVPNGCGGGCWAVYLQREYPVGASPRRAYELILANVKMLVSGQTFRLNNVENLVIVDSFLNAGGGGVNGWRVHFGTTDVYVRDTISVGVGVAHPPGGTDIQVHNGIYENHIRYGANRSENFIGECRYIDNVTVRNSTGYAVESFGHTSPNLWECIDGGGNSLLPWDGVTLPDHSGYGADH